MAKVEQITAAQAAALVKDGMIHGKRYTGMHY